MFKRLFFLFSLSARSLVIAVLALGMTAVAFAAWSGPPAGSPPNNCTTGVAGCDAPVNVGSTAQIKTGSFGTLTGAMSTHNGLLFDSLTADPAVTTGNLYNKNGNIYWSGNAILTSGSGISGSGSGNYLAKFTGATTLGNSLIYDNGTNVGIGNTNPGDKLQVSGDIGATGAWIGGNGVAGTYIFYQSNAGYLYSIQNGVAFKPLIISGSTISLQNSGTNSLYIDGSGLVGIGTAVPKNQLTVNSAWSTYANPEAFSIKGTYPSMTFRSSTTGGVWLVHMSGNSYLNWYNANDGNIDSTNWGQKMYLGPTGDLWAASTISAAGTMYANGSAVCQVNGVNCPASIHLGGQFWVGGPDGGGGAWCPSGSVLVAWYPGPNVVCQWLQ